MLVNINVSQLAYMYMYIMLGFGVQVSQISKCRSVSNPTAPFMTKGAVLYFFYDSLRIHCPVLVLLPDPDCNLALVLFRNIQKGLHVHDVDEQGLLLCRAHSQSAFKHGGRGSHIVCGALCIIYLSAVCKWETGDWTTWPTTKEN